MHATGYEREPRWFGDERGLPPCRDPEHRHSGPCESWAIPPVSWRDNVRKQVTTGSRRLWRVTHLHRPTGLVVNVEGSDLDRAQEACAAELGRLLDELGR